MTFDYNIIKQQIIEIYFDSSREYYLEQGRYTELVDWAYPEYTVEKLKSSGR
jgi:hypothetical protein